MGSNYGYSQLIPRMFHIKKDSEGTLHLVGVLDDTVILKGLLSVHLSEAGPEIRLNCREISRINSIGIKGWRDTFENLRKSGKKLRFVEISPALVDQINSISGLVPTSEIESFCLPFECENCGNSYCEVSTVEKLQKVDLEAMEIRCQSCGKAMVFDEIADVYLAFAR